MTQKQKSLGEQAADVKQKAREAATFNGAHDGMKHWVCFDAAVDALATQDAASGQGQADTVHRHVANEWADMAANGLQWLRNVRDGISTAEEAITNMEDNLKHCYDVRDNPPWGKAAYQPTEPSQQPESIIFDSPETGYPSRIIDGKHVPCTHDGRVAQPKPAQQAGQSVDDMRDASHELTVTELISQRDYREEIIDRILDVVLGKDRPEWSSSYGFLDAALDVDEHMASQPPALGGGRVQAQAPAAWQGEIGSPTTDWNVARSWAEKGGKVTPIHTPSTEAREVAQPAIDIAQAQQSSAWLEIVEVLDAVAPGWADGDEEDGAANACAAIRRLAEQASDQPQGDAT